MWKRPLRVLFWIAGAGAILFVGFAVVSGAMIALPAMLFPTPGHIIVENHASEPVREANIEILGKGYLLRGIEPNQSAAFDFSYRGSGGYKIGIVFRSGRQLTMDERDLESLAAMEFTDTVTITDDGIRITTICVKNPNVEPSCTHPEIR